MPNYHLCYTYNPHSPVVTSSYDNVLMDISNVHVTVDYI